MSLSSNNVADASQIRAFDDGEWVTRGFIALKASNLNPASLGETGDRYCSKTRSLFISLSASSGTWKYELDHQWRAKRKKINKKQNGESWIGFRFTLNLSNCGALSNQLFTFNWSLPCDDTSAISFFTGLPTTSILLAWRQVSLATDPPKEARLLTCVNGFSSRDNRFKLSKLKELEPGRWRRKVIQMMRHLTGFLNANFTCLGTLSSPFNFSSP